MIYATPILTEKDNNGEVNIVKNSDLIIKLKYSASTGYRWNAIECTAGVLKEITQEPVDNTPGASNTVVFLFNISSDGVIVLDYGRKFETKNIKFFIIKIKVKNDSEIS